MVRRSYIRPRRRAVSTAPSLFLARSFRRALRTWFRTVCELRLRSAAISPISSPRANRRNTSTSRMDKGSTWPPAESADPAACVICNESASSTLLATVLAFAPSLRSWNRCTRTLCWSFSVIRGVTVMGFSHTRRASRRDMDHRRDNPFSGELDSGATFHAHRRRPALRKALQDLVASEPDDPVRGVAEDLLGAAIPEQNGLAHVHGVNAVRCLT